MPSRRYPALTVDPEFRRELALWFALAATFYVVSAVCNISYSHPDQHFQVFEFADHWQKGTRTANMPWEYHYAMRPWLHPFLVLGVMNLLDTLGVGNPFVHLAVVRLLTGALGLAATLLFCIAVARWLPLPGQRKWLAVVFALFWLFPEFHTRTGSETMAAICLMLALSALFLLRRQVPRPPAGTAWPAPFTGPATFTTEGLVPAAVFLGLMFQFRYQTGFLIVAIAVWMVLIAKAPGRQMALFCAVICGVTALGVGLDSIGYGRFELAPWNYIKANLIDGEAARMGESRWYYFMLNALGNPISLLMLVALAVFAWRHPGSLMTWLVLTLFVVHSLVAHKEFRFILPVVFLALAMVVCVIPARRYGPGDRIPLAASGWPGRLLLAALAVFNAASFVIDNLRPPRADLGVQRFVQSHAPQAFAYHSMGYAMYDWHRDHISGLPVRMEFFAPASVTRTVVATPADLLAAIRDEGALIFAYPANDLPDRADWAAVRQACTEIYQTFGPFMRRLNLDDWQSREAAVSLFDCRVAPPPAG